MKTPAPDPPHTDRTRLSPTQADGGPLSVPRSPSRRAPAPASLSDDYQPQKQKQQQQQTKNGAPENADFPGQATSPEYDDGGRPGVPSGDAGHRSFPSGSGRTSSNTEATTDTTVGRGDNAGRANNTGDTTAGCSTITVSPAPASAASVPDARSRAVVEGDVGSGSGSGSGSNGNIDNNGVVVLPPVASPVPFSSPLPDYNIPVKPTLANGGVGGGSMTSINRGVTEYTAEGHTEEKVADADNDGPQRHPALALAIAFFATTRAVLLHSWLNVFLVFVPAGIAVGAAPAGTVPPSVVFALNAVAIVPLAGLLGFATETVAHRMGDSIGALLNITFGNAVELIIFIALVKNQIRIVQASLLGSILANLLLILGMGLLLGGLRFREQIYNSTVTQMSACLLSLSVISLVLPTAFHASFNDRKKADAESLKISRGTSVVLLLVYGIYLLFQLKSHAYMYESTPQHIIDEEATPGPAAAWLDSSSSDDSSSSSSDSDSSGHSRDTMRKRMRRVIRRGRRRKSSVASLDTADTLFAAPTRTPSFSTVTAAPAAVAANTTTADDFVWEESSTSSSRPAFVSRLASTDMSEEAIDEDDVAVSRPRTYRQSKRARRRDRKNKKRSVRLDHDAAAAAAADVIFEHATGRSQLEDATNAGKAAPAAAAFLTTAGMGGKRIAVPVLAAADPVETTRRVDFALSDPATHKAVHVDESGNPMAASTGAAATDLASARRAFNLRAMSLRPVAKSLAPTVFTQPALGGVAPPAAATAGPIPRVRYGIHRTNSLPDRLNRQYQLRPPGAMLPSHIPTAAVAHGVAGGIGGSGGGGGGSSSGGMTNGADTNGLTVVAMKHTAHGEYLALSRRAAVLTLLITTGLVAACAEFMVGSIKGLVATSSVGEVFIGLIILPIVGNAAEHVTAVMVAMKNKMDLAIGVAVGSSIQIALFMTPLVVILGWIIGRDMTLYFTLFETVCLFVSAFIVNFLVLDGRSNYLEGALLCATYVIIGLAAFYYPSADDASSWG
ncbi:calcium/sodium antiporter [Niveomyces insectorum RCEF 264]|uniref:Calcium/sodium antiporter n=1 Tax=Niveomyces insectorum RCEF 264 TaxID=1081102 RepID=A0A162MF77_9HYPO|nr:calcium/sodium antiporter [Niveomyces insectorum RCEF 264]